MIVLSQKTTRDKSVDWENEVLMVTNKTGNSPLHPSMRQRNPPTLLRSAEEDGGSHSSVSCFNHCDPPSAVSSPQIQILISLESETKYLFRQ